MKVFLFDGSANPGGTIAALLGRVGEALAAEGLEVEQVRLEPDRRTGCYMCGQCSNKRDDDCSRPMEDGLRRALRRLLAADAVVIGSPAYSVGASPAVQRLMVLLDRRIEVKGAPLLAGKVAAIVVDVRNERAPFTHATIADWLRAREAIVVGEPRPPAAGDGAWAEAVAAMAQLGHTVARALERLQRESGASV